VADVRPFRGVTYDPAAVDPAAVLCPPYDVISPRQQEAYYARDGRNFVRVVLNRDEGAMRYTGAATALHAWLDEGVLRRAGAPAFYVHRHTFKAPTGVTGIAAGTETTRTGVIAAVRLEPWSAGAVRPHEHTMPGPKADRLELMRATAADTEPIWVFHPDPGAAVRDALATITEAPPTLVADFTPEPSSEERPDPERHALWEVSDPAEVRSLQASLSAVQLYIADGHHRYETALFHAEEVGGGPDDASRFKVMLISPMEDPGLLALPTHRLVKLPPGRTLGDLLARLRTWGWRSEQPATLTALLDRLARPPALNHTGFGLLAERRYGCYEGMIASPEVELLPRALRTLEVALLHQGILGPLLGIDAAVAAAGTHLAYSRDPLEVRDRVVRGEFDLGIFLRPPLLAQVRDVADAGENMPQKSTYFWPKPTSGLVLALQEPGQPL
jgi:uncharacterized protein (DUF1015 family)